ncbi:PaaI family thioesterase [Mycolicibacterium mucogenicum]|uniref:PaaI family thioesterase n=1 Tax=Mycolicibacterium mucogenicum TaxID=56689 RepID=UPI0013F4E3A9|nr:PaaI family thioesterase [Mycolicibacterium mucogenicum]
MLQQRYDDAVTATNGLGIAARLLEFSPGRLTVTASLDRFVRPGGTIPGPVQVTLVDGLSWLLLVAHMPEGADAYTTDMSVQFLRAVPLGEVTATLVIERLGSSRAVVTTVIAPLQDPDHAIAHLVLGFALRGNRPSS